MTFSITISCPNRNNDCLYEIQINDYRESNTLLTTRWSLSEYEEQWRGALTSLVNFDVNRCALITDIQPEENSYGVMYWALFREGDIVFFQERFLRENIESFIASPQMAEKFMPDRIQGSPEEHRRVSEWVLPISDIHTFLISSKENFQTGN